MPTAANSAGCSDRAPPEDPVALLRRETKNWLRPGLLARARGAPIAVGVAREPGHRVHEEVLVAEELDEEVVRELGVAVHDEPPWRGARPRQARASGTRPPRPTRSGPRRSRPLHEVPARRARARSRRCVAQLSWPVLQERRCTTVPRQLRRRSARTERVREKSGARGRAAPRIGCAPPVERELHRQVLAAVEARGRIDDHVARRAARGSARGSAASAGRLLRIEQHEHAARDAAGSGRAPPAPRAGSPSAARRSRARDVPTGTSPPSERDRHAPRSTPARARARACAVAAVADRCSSGRPRRARPPSRSSGAAGASPGGWPRSAISSRGLVTHAPAPLALDHERAVRLDVVLARQRRAPVDVDRLDVDARRPPPNCRSRSRMSRLRGSWMRRKARTRTSRREPSSTCVGVVRQRVAALRRQVEPPARARRARPARGGRSRPAPGRAAITRSRWPRRPSAPAAPLPRLQHAQRRPRRSRPRARGSRRRRAASIDADRERLEVVEERERPQDRQRRLRRSPPRSTRAARGAAAASPSGSPASTWLSVSAETKSPYDAHVAREQQRGPR